MNTGQNWGRDKWKSWAQGYEVEMVNDKRKLPNMRVCAMMDGWIGWMMTSDIKRQQGMKHLKCSRSITPTSRERANVLDREWGCKPLRRCLRTSAGCHALSHRQLSLAKSDPEELEQKHTVAAVPSCSPPAQPSGPDPSAPALGPSPSSCCC